MLTLSENQLSRVLVRYRFFGGVPGLILGALANCGPALLLREVVISVLFLFESSFAHIDFLNLLGILIFHSRLLGSLSNFHVLDEVEVDKLLPLGVLYGDVLSLLGLLVRYGFGCSVWRDIE